MNVREVTRVRGVVVRSTSAHLTPVNMAPHVQISMATTRVPVLLVIQVGTVTSFGSNAL